MSLDETIVALARRRGRPVEEMRAYAEREITRAVRDARAGIYQTLDNLDNIDVELRAEAGHRLRVAHARGS